MQNSREFSRIKLIDRRLSRLSKKHRKAYDKWARYNRERMDLSHEMKNLIAEKDELVQGQFILPIPPSGPDRSDR